MGDKKPKRNSSGNADAYKAKKAKHLSEQPPAANEDPKKKK